MNDQLQVENVPRRFAVEESFRSRLDQIVVDLWIKAEPPARATVEYLFNDHVGNDVLNILRIAQASVGAVVPYRPLESDRIAIYSAHAELRSAHL